jgi:hypothetical protein
MTTEDDSDLPDIERTFEWPQPDTASEQWRSVTFEALRSRVEQSPRVEDADEGTNDAIKDSYEANMRDISTKISAALQKVSQHDPEAITGVVTQASRLALDFRVRRCRLQFFSPPLHQTITRTDQMYKTHRDVNNRNHGFTTSRGKVGLIAATGLRRTGNSRGYTFNAVVDLWPADIDINAL